MFFVGPIQFLKMRNTLPSHDTKLFKAKITRVNNRYGQRLCLETWHINASSCALNRDDDSYLPQEYLHLVGK